MKTIAAGDEVAMQRVAPAAVRKRDAGLAAVDAMQGHAADLEQDGRAIRQARGDQVLDHFVLAVHGNGAAAGWAGQVDVVADPVVQQVDAMVAQALALQALAHTGCHQQVNRPLLQHASPDASFHVLAAAVLEDHGIDAGAVQQMAQQQACRPGADDRDLGAHPGLPPPVFVARLAARMGRGGSARPLMLGIVRRATSFCNRGFLRYGAYGCQECGNTQGGRIATYARPADSVRHRGE